MALLFFQKTIFTPLYGLNFELIINRLTDEEIKLTEGKYLLNLSNYQIADILHCSEKRVRTMQKKIIYKIADWSGKFNTADLAI